jgi:hypothetical protein
MDTPKDPGHPRKLDKAHEKTARGLVIGLPKYSPVYLEKRDDLEPRETKLINTRFLIQNISK